LIRGLESRYKGGADVSLEEPEEGRAAAMVAAEAAEEAGVGGEAAPALADERRTGEGGGLRREAEEDLAEEVVVFKRRLHRRRAGAADGGAHLALDTEAGEDWNRNEVKCSAGRNSANEAHGGLNSPQRHKRLHSHLFFSHKKNYVFLFKFKNIFNLKT
jgi:hypothetical protein